MSLREVTEWASLLVCPLVYRLAKDGRFSSGYGCGGLGRGLSLNVMLEAALRSDSASASWRASCKGVS